jgi:PAS domain S-box-containing protein
VAKRRYSLSDIENLLTFLPLIFIGLFSLLVLGIMFVSLSTSQKHEISILSQHQQLQIDFERQKALDRLVEGVKDKIARDLDLKERALKAHVDYIQGVIAGLAKPDTMLGITELLPYFRKLESDTGIRFAVLSEDTLLPSYGLEEIRTIQELIFNNYNNPRSMQLTILYILSQGTKSTMTWKNEPAQTLWLSHFQAIDYNDWYIGAFSTVDSIPSLTKATLEESIKRSKEPFTFWLYDYENNLFFTAKKGWHKPAEATQIGMQNTLQELFNSPHLEDQKKHPFLYDYNRFRLVVGVSEPKNKPFDASNIVQKFESKRFIWSVIILAFTGILIGFSLMFSGFIKRIFASYNRRFERRNRLLQALKERFELAIIASNDGLWDTNFKTGKTFFSATWLQMLGYSKDDISTYEEWKELIHKDDKERVMKSMQEHFLGKKEHFVSEYRLRTKLGRYRWVLARGKLFKDKEGNFERLLMMTMPIVERKRMQKAIEDTHKLAKSGHIVLLRWTNDAFLTLTFASQSIKRFGYTPDDVLQTSITYMDLIHPDDRQHVRSKLDDAISRGKDAQSLSYRILTKNGNPRWVFSHAIFLRDDFGKVTDLYGYIYDITAIKASEQELARRVKEEVDKNREKEKILIQQSKLAAMGEMLGAIAHQWRQPLNHISLLLHFIRDMFIEGKLDEASMRRYTNEAKAQIEYMSQTIDDFHNFYQPSKDKSNFKVKEALKKAVEIVKHQFSHHNISLSVEGNECEIFGYENEFKQVILNILSNAKDAILLKSKEEPIEGRITLTCKVEKREVVVTISNNGGNISDEIMERIFEPYFTTKFETQGTGIGLYMCKTIVETNMQGQITAQNIKDGVSFIIHLPR